MSSINIVRIRDSLGTGRDLKVYIDDTYSGSIPYASEDIFELEPGTHQIYVKMDWCRSKSFEFEILSGESKRLFCGSKFANKSIFVGMFVSIFVPRSLLYVGTESLVDTSKTDLFKNRKAKWLAFFLTPLLILPILGILRVIGVLTIEFSTIFGEYSHVVIIGFTIFYLFSVVFIAISLWKWLSNYFANNPID